MVVSRLRRRRPKNKILFFGISLGLGYNLEKKNSGFGNGPE